MEWQELVSAREAEVLAAIRGHQSNAQIAASLHLSVRTVESHVASLLRKAGVPDRRTLAALADTSSSGSGLPVYPTSFVGREHECVAVPAALEGARLVSLVGAGGMGKTRLAVEVAGSLDGEARFVDLVPVRTGGVGRAVAQVLGVVERPPGTPADAVIDRLRTQRTVLVLDNCEHVIAEVGALVARILRLCPHTTILATSRERLAVPGERLVQVLSLGHEAQRLFLDRALAADPDFVAEPAAVERLCAALDRMPLAMELVAARTASLGVDGVGAGLDDLLRLISGGRGPDRRHHSLGEVIGWSLELLDDEERLLFRRLGVFVGGFDLDAVAALNPEQSVGVVADLVRQAGRPEPCRTSASRRDHPLVAVGDGPGGRRPRSGDEWRGHRTAVRAVGREHRRPDGGTHRPASGRRVRTRSPTTCGTRSSWPTRTVRHTGWRSRSPASVSPVDSSWQPATTTVRPPNWPRPRPPRPRTLARPPPSRWRSPTGKAGFGLLLQASARAAAAGDRTAQAVAMASAVLAATRFSMCFTDPVPRDRLVALLAEATALVDPADQRSAAVLAMARAWVSGQTPLDPDLELSRAAVAAARRCGEAALVLGALDALGMALANAGRLRQAHRLSDERLRLAATASRYEPAVAAELVDLFHVASTSALAAGDLAAAASITEQGFRDSSVSVHPAITAPRLIRLDGLTGRFDEVLAQADVLWDGWLYAATAGVESELSSLRGDWPSSAAAIVALVHGVRGDVPRFEEWRSRALRMAHVDDAASSRALAAPAAFTDARVAAHTGRYVDAPGLVAAALAAFPERWKWWLAYAHATGAELAVVAGLPDAAERLVAAEPAAAENDWAAACLARATARHTGNPELMAESVDTVGAPRRPIRTRRHAVAGAGTGRGG